VLALVKKNRKTVEAAEHERLALFSLNNEACAHSVRLWARGIGAGRFCREHCNSEWWLLQ
jgi:hypothetical protein